MDLMQKVYVVQLSIEEREQLQELVKKETARRDNGRRRSNLQEPAS